jgi:hypothetical protein
MEIVDIDIGLESGWLEGGGEDRYDIVATAKGHRAT